MVIASMARKPVWSDITVTTSSGFLATSFDASVEAPPTQDNQVKNDGGGLLIGGGDSPGFMNKRLEVMLKRLSSQRADNAYPLCCHRGLTIRVGVRPVIRCIVVLIVVLWESRKAH